MVMGGKRHGTLVIQPLPGIGDMIWHLPHLHAIAGLSPEGKISVLTKPRSLADRLLGADPSVAEVLWLERGTGRGGHQGLLGLIRLIGLLRRKRFQRVWVLHGSTRYALAAFLAGIPERIGYGRGAQRYFLNGPVTLTPQEARAHPIDKANRLLERYGLAREPEPRLVVAEAAIADIERRYAGQPRPWIAVGIGSSEPYKQWGAERFAELIGRLDKQAPGSYFLLGGEGEREMAADLQRAAGRGDGRVIPVIAEPLDQVAALLKQCSAYVGNDTGMLNLAAAAGIPAIGLFGASKPLRHSRFIHPVLPSEGAAERGGDGMRKIGVDQVLAAIQEYKLT